MSYKYLQDYIYYSELYDRMTIDECECWDSEVYDAHAKSGKKFDPAKPSRRLHGGLLADLHLYFVKGENYLDKETTINEWMKRDQAKDEKLENAIEPKGVRIDALNKEKFTLQDIYDFEKDLALMHSENKNIKPKIRQQLQFLRDKGYLEFLGNGVYVLK